MYCPKCDKESEGDFFCPICGSPLTVANPRSIFTSDSSHAALKEQTTEEDANFGDQPEVAVNNQEEESQTTYCKKCGARMAASGRRCKECGARRGQGDKYCSACGSKTNRLATFCSRCGVALTSKRRISARMKENKYCPGCGTKSKKRMNFCLRCGTDLQPKPIDVAGNRYCIVCGASTDQSAAFCRKCGARLIPIQLSQETSSSSPSVHSTESNPICPKCGLLMKFKEESDTDDFMETSCCLGFLLNAPLGCLLMPFGYFLPKRKYYVCPKCGRKVPVR